MEKKWPTMAQILIGLGCIGSLLNIGRLLFTKDIIQGVMGVASLVIWWNLYKFKPWALSALTVLLAINVVILIVYIILQMIPAVVGIIVTVYIGSVIWYFNSPSIRALVKSQ